MDRTKWKKAQELEFKYHQTSELRENDAKWEVTNQRFLGKSLGVDLELEGKSILDLGCGSRLRTKLFAKKNRVVGIDPLIEEYKKIPFCDINDVEHYSVPAEEFLEQLSGEFDYVFCLNVLDHCLNEKTVLENAYKYLKKGGLFYLWTDIGHTDDMHESGMNCAELKRFLVNLGFELDRVTEGVDPSRFMLTDEPDYRRCGVPCNPGVLCVVVRAIKK